MAADRGRSEVYAAELAAYDGTDLEVVEPFAEIASFAAGIVSGSWWPGGPVRVEPARSDARSSSARAARSRRVTQIRLARPQWTRATVLHELAHALAGPGAGHGPLFRRAHVDIATVAFGGERGGWLATAYAESGLSLAARQWVPPPAAEAPIRGPIAL